MKSWRSLTAALAVGLLAANAGLAAQSQPSRNVMPNVAKGKAGAPAPGGGKGGSSINGTTIHPSSSGINGTGVRASSSGVDGTGIHDKH